MKNLCYSFLFLSFFLTISFGQERPGVVYPVFSDDIGKITNSVITTTTESATSIDNVFQAGADRLASLQNNDGGWDWELDDGNPNSTSPLNTLGPIAMGLAKAYYFTGDGAHLATLTDAAALLLTKTNNFSPSDGYLAIALDELFGVTTYSQHVIDNFYNPLAEGTYNKNGLGILYNTATYINQIRTNRSGIQANMAAWDVGMGLVGASMCGANTADWIVGVKAEINELDGAAYYDVIGLAGALYGLAFAGEEFDPTTGQHAAASNLMDLANTLASYQIQLGGFAWNSAWVIPNDGDEAIQETAYSILALDKISRQTFLPNIIGAGNYLINIQLVTGGWKNYNYVGSTSSENNEVTGEALWAIHTAFPQLWVSTSGNDANSGSINNPLATLGKAITDIPFAGIINVETGIYSSTEQINIQKELSIIGTGSTTVLRPDFNTTNVGNVQSESWLYIAPGVNVTLKDFKMDGQGKQINHAIQSRGNLTAENLTIDNIYYNIYAGRGIVLFSGNSNIKSCTFSNIQRIGIHVRGNVTTPNPTGSIQNCTYTGKGTGDFLDYGVEVGGGGTATVDNLTASNCLGVASTDGSTSAGILVTDYWGTGTEATITNSNIQNCTSGLANGYSPDDNSVTEIHNSSLVNNQIGVTNNSTIKSVNAENNWWGDASGPYHATLNPSGSGAPVSDNVDFDPWTGAGVTVTQTGQNISFSNSDIILNFSTLPAGGGNVTIQRYNGVPPGFPSNLTNLGLWLDFGTSMANFTFNVTVKVDVDNIPGFDATTTVMYYNGSNWLAVAGGSYLASDPVFGGHASFSFVTNHFTPFTFINTPATAHNVYLSSTTNAAAGIIYPNTDWGITSYDPDDWDFTTPMTLYVVPEVGSEFAACDFTIEWDNSMLSFSGVVNDGIFGLSNFIFFQNQLGNTTRITINASRTDNDNFNTIAGDYIAKLNLNLLKPGYGAINFTNLDFRHYDGVGGFSGIYVTGNGAQVKAYLGDVATDGSEATGDGLVDFEDLSLWAASYWSGVPGYSGGMTNYKVKYDVGPTANNTVYALPTVDSKIQFEDLVIFAMSYGLSGDNVYPKIVPVPTEPVELILGEPVTAGNETLLPILISGAVQDVRAIQMNFSGQFGKLIGVDKGGLLKNIEAPSLLLNRTENNQVFVDLAVVGANSEAINLEGELVVLRFEGSTNVNLNSAVIRNSSNNNMLVKITGNEDAVPTIFSLAQNYPNPFNPSTKIEYQVPQQALVEIIVYNSIGEKVTTLVSEIKETGNYSVDWNASSLSSGIYFYQMKAGDFVSVKKLILMK